MRTSIEHFRAYGSIALAEEGARGALITSMPDMNIVSASTGSGTT